MARSVFQTQRPALREFPPGANVARDQIRHRTASLDLLRSYAANGLGVGLSYTNPAASLSHDGKPLATAIVNGADPAHAFECDVSGVSQLQLSLTSRGLDSKSNYAVWADPVLVKKD